jgi:exopolysaccharide biosynthesis protein
MAQIKYIKSASSYLFLFYLILIFLASCSSSDDEIVKIEHKGAKTTLMQSIADYMDKIQSVEDDASCQIVDGLTITNARFTYLTHPTQMFVAEVDLTKNLSVVTCTPYNENIQNQRQTIPEQMVWAEKAGKNVLLGVNGDFAGENADKTKIFTMNIFVKDGQIIKDTYYPGYEGLFIVLKNGESKIIHPKDFDGMKDDVLEAMGGYHSLVNNGQENKNLPVDDITMQFAPRTFVGLSEDNKKCFLFVIDGRQEGYSFGMRLEDVATLCKGAGCYNAINLDGGGSSTFVVKDKTGNFKVLNKPSDGELRPVINGLIVIKK